MHIKCCLIFAILAMTYINTKEFDPFRPSFNILNFIQLITSLFCPAQKKKKKKAKENSYYYYFMVVEINNFTG